MLDRVVKFCYPAPQQTSIEMSLKYRSEGTRSRMPTSVTAPQAASPAHDAAAELQARLQAFQRIVAVDRLLTIQHRFEGLLSSLCQAVRSGVGTHHAMLGIVGTDADHYPLQVGFEPPMAPHPHRLGLTLCQHLVLQGKSLAIEDTHASPTWADVKSVREGVVGAYLGVPVRFQGEMVGSLCAVSHEPRAWQAQDHALMQSLAKLAEDAFEAAWRQEVAQRDAEQTQLRLQALEAGIIQRQMAFREIRQALAMQATRLRLAPEGTRATEAEWLERLHQQLGEVNEGVLSDVSNAASRTHAADTSCGELLALAAHVVAPDRIRLDDVADALGSLSTPVAAMQQPALLRTFVTVLRESLRPLTLRQAASGASGVSTRLLPVTDGRCALRVQAWGETGGEPAFPADLPRRVEAMICSTLKELDARLSTAPDAQAGQALLLTWSAAA